MMMMMMMMVRILGFRVCIFRVLFSGFFSSSRERELESNFTRHKKTKGEKTNTHDASSSTRWWWCSQRRGGDVLEEKRDDVFESNEYYCE